MKTKTDASGKEQRCALRSFDGHLMSYPEMAKKDWSISNPITFCSPILTLLGACNYEDLEENDETNIKYCSSLVAAIFSHLSSHLMMSNSYTYRKCKKDFF